jgi:hypothetical protein
MRMDKSAFSKQSFEDAANHKKIYDSMDATERSSVFYILMSTAYGFVGKPWPKMEKNIFSKRKQDA